MNVGKPFGRWAGVGGLLLAGLFLAGCASDQYSEQQFSEMPGVTVTPSGTTTNVVLPIMGGATPVSAAPAPANPATATASGYEVLQVGDSLTINFADLVTPLPPFDETIKEDGTITLIQNQTFNAAGKTRGKLEREIHDRYVPKYFVNLTVTIKLQGQFYFVDGEVKAPNRYPYYGSKMTVLKAIASAGDFTDYANRKKVKLTRGDRTTQVINCIAALKDPRLDVEVFSGDKIHVPRKLF